MLNLTPHAVTLDANGVRISIPPSGIVARVAVTEKPATAIQPELESDVAAALGQPGALTIADHEHQLAVAIPVVTREFGQVEGLPDDDAPCIVSSLVLEAVRAQQPWRRRVYAPDTGPTAIRDEAGRIVAVRRLVTL